MFLLSYVPRLFQRDPGEGGCDDALMKYFSAHEVCSLRVPLPGGSPDQQSSADSESEDSGSEQ